MRLALQAAALAVLVLPLVAMAMPKTKVPEVKKPPVPGVEVPPASEIPRPDLAGVDITWYGQSGFLIVSPAGVTVLVDPFSEQIGLPLPSAKLTVDAVAITHEHADHNNVAGFVEGSPKVIRGLALEGNELAQAQEVAKVPEFARVQELVKDIKISTVPSFHDNDGGKKRGKNAIFVFDIAGMRFVHMGDFGQAKVTAEQKKALGKIDVLFVPVGGHYTIDPEQAAAIVKDLKPRRAVLPMHYKLPGLTIAELGPVDPFLAKFPADQVRKVDGPTVRFVPMPKEPKNFDVIVLKP